MKNIVITGSTRGIGFGLADAFLALGCCVVVSGRSQAGVDAAVKTLITRHPAERVIGLVCDVLSGGAPGFWAASFVATYAVLDKQRDAFAGLSGWGAILGFATAALIACTANYAINSLCSWKLLPVNDAIKEFAVTSIMYAIVLPVLGWTHRRFVGPLRSEF